DKLKDELSNELAHWTIDVFKGSARGVKHTAFTAGSCVALGLHVGDQNSRCSFDIRFWEQVGSKAWSFVANKGVNSPINQITKLVVEDSKKNRPNSYIKAIAKFTFSNRLKAVSVNVVIAQISSYLVDVTVARYIANKSAQGYVKGFVSAGVGVVVSLGDIAETSYQSALRLKMKNNRLYMELYKRNLECYWFLVEENLKGFAYKNG
ncbi:hypothetical protein IBE48_09755, partial [Francisella philomiragia]